jgi:GST-like protein
VIDLHYWPTPNGWKISIALEEMGLAYRVVPVDIGRGEQSSPEFLAVGPNGKMPAILDHEPAGGGAPLAIFESGAILVYLAEDRAAAAGPAPASHRVAHGRWRPRPARPVRPLHPLRAREAPYAIELLREIHRLGVMNGRLEGASTWPTSSRWPTSRASAGCEAPRRTNLARDGPGVKRWYDGPARPAVQRGFDAGREALETQPGVDAEAKAHLFGHARK